MNVALPLFSNRLSIQSLTAPGPEALLSFGDFRCVTSRQLDATTSAFEATTLLLLLDNYDSFTYNLYHYLGELGGDVLVRRHDALSVDQALALEPEAIVISPGPCDPDKAGISLDLVKAAAGRCPVLGVCLGHQAIAQAFGGRIVRAPALMHGKVSDIHHDGDRLFDDIPSPFTATRYHSLIAEADSLPDCFEVTARTDDGVIMAIRHREMSIQGVQFHPESIETRHGHRLLSNFLATLPSAGQA